ncbi:MAG: RnfABCDGE type electron transport complex subunit D [Candidatus Omnitrophota bacterium]
MSENLNVSTSPHIHSGKSVNKIMWLVFFSLVPAGIWSVYCYGFRALLLILVSIAACVGTEALILKLRKSSSSAFDGSAALTGLLLAYNVTPTLPIWAICVGAVFAIAVGKQAFGGLGRNIFNPALVGRAFLMASWPTHMVNFMNPRWQVDAVTSATPLTIMKHKFDFPLPSYLDLLVGNRGGCIGEVCIIALLLGALFLLVKNVIDWRLPLSYIVSFALLSWFFMGEGFLKGDWLFQVLSGGLILGAFFMATDYVTSPITKKGRLIGGVLCGVLTFVIRKWGGYPEGVSYSILVMNAAAPIIERHTKPRRFGGKNV